MRGRLFGIVAVAGLTGVAGFAAAPVDLGGAEWAQKVSLKGDLRYRYETRDEEGKDLRELHRLRARVGVEGKVNDTVKAGVQVSSGSSDPVSSNQTLTDGFSRKNLYIDLAYIDWALLPELSLVGGKIKNPFMSVSDLIWDGDLNPEGLALQARGAREALDLSAGAGYLWVQERSGEDDDTMLYAAQAAVKYNFTDEVYVEAGGGYYGYDEIEGRGLIDFENSNKSYGNSTRKVVSGGTTNVIYDLKYNLVEGFAELGIWAGIPFRAYGHYVVNTEADENDTGYQAGIGIGKAKNPKTYELNYSYYDLEKDAVVGAFTDSDRHGGGTDGRGHKLQAKYQLLKNLQLGLTYFMTEKTISDDAKKHDYDRLQLDLVANF
jgi:hypothetical protein